MRARVLEDSSWLGWGCCAPVWEGEKGDEVDEAEDVRLAIWRFEAGCAAGKVECTGEKLLREGLLDAVEFRLALVEMGVKPRRALC